ncbi:MAG: ACP S-malonyltransferase [Anaerolineales bacterium]|nr:ACP S-malonyltransferase [Anaerolineales bacterium]
MTLDPKRTAFVFPGQGSQVVGMGKALAEKHPEARRLFEEVDALLGFSLTRLCWEGPDGELADTFNTQPALLTHSVAAWRVLTDALGGFQPLCVAGHSMGEFSALVASGALPFPDALRLTRERGRVMSGAGKTTPGGMAAILNCPAAVLEKLCVQAAQETGGIVGVANDNCPGQVVISGEDRALARAMALALQSGARRAVRLHVSIGSHSPLMKEAALEFARAVNAAPLADPRMPLIGNVGAAPLRTSDALRDDINAQLTSPVRWVESVRAMQALGADTFIELGSKDVLTGLIKRIDPAVRAMAAGSPEEIRSVLGV